MIMQDKSSELIKYFAEYSQIDIKKAAASISLPNAQAILIYSFVNFYWDYAISRY
jgi:hypothetical protein